jgi:hypothetical protein
MSDAVARRLLALLSDEPDIESAPLAEVRADLAALGLDPARSIALGRSLAAKAASPQAILLRRIAISEEGDDDIHRLERAAIGDIHQRLPFGTTGAAVATAQRAAGRDSNLVGLRRRRARRLLYGLSAAAATLAASVILVVGLYPEGPSFVPSEPAGSSGTAIETARLEVQAEQLAQPRADSEAAGAQYSSVGQDGPVALSKSEPPQDQPSDSTVETVAAAPVPPASEMGEMLSD